MSRADPNHRYGYSWEGYRKVRKGVKKRISRHMQQLRCRTIDEYFSSLDRDEEVRKHCECLMTVSVSHFFRDRFLWKIIEDQILPGIIEESRENIKTWSAGCACGEEVYFFQPNLSLLIGKYNSFFPFVSW